MLEYGKVLSSSEESGKIWLVRWSMERYDAARCGMIRYGFTLI